MKEKINYFLWHYRLIEVRKNKYYPTIVSIKRTLVISFHRKHKAFFIENSKFFDFKFKRYVL